MSERNPANGIAEQLLCEAEESTDEVSQFFYLYTAANALYLQYHFAQCEPNGTSRDELSAFKRWIADLPLPALKAVVNPDVVDGMLHRIPFDDQTGAELPNEQGAVINYYESRLTCERKMAGLNADVIDAAQRDDPHEETIKNANRSLAKFIYTVRCNLFHGQKDLPHEANEQLLEQCSAVLERWVKAGLSH